MFLNPENLEPHPDQWSYLSTLGRMTPKEVTRAADKAGRVPAGREVNVLAAMLAKRAPGYPGLGFPDPRKITLTPSASTDRQPAQPAAISY